MSIRAAKGHEISYERRLEMVFKKIKVKAIVKLRQLLAAPGVQLCCVQKIL